MGCVYLAKSQSEDEGTNEIFEFDCPECGEHIVGEVSRCPKCGVEFVIEEVAEFECPQCGANVPVDATRCSQCGKSLDGSEEREEVTATPQEAISAIEAVEKDYKVGLDEKQLKDEFSRMVIEIKPLMMMARDFGIDTTNARRLVDKSVMAGRQRNVRAALRYIEECKEILVSSIKERLERDVMYMENLAQVAEKLDSDPNTIKKVIGDTKSKLDAGDLEGSLAEAKNGKKMAEQLTGSYVEAHEMYEVLERMVQNAERFYIDVREARKLLNEAREAGEHGDWNMMGIVARKGRETLDKGLSPTIRGELKKAKEDLLLAKASGKDVSTLVKILKDAGTDLKRERYEGALERLNEFRIEYKNLNPA